MSLAIDIDRVDAVLLPDGTWYNVAEASFFCDAYEFLDYGGSEERRNNGDYIWLTQPKAESAGFGFRTPEGSIIYGPITAIVAVRVRDTKQ